MSANNVTLYAQWSVNTYTITYHDNEAWGGSVPSPQIANYNTQLTVHANTGDLHQTATPSYPGEGSESYKFKGWNTKDDGTGDHYDAGDDPIFVTEDITLYAEWGEYQVRDQGPSGGWIFYKKGNWSDGWRYLEVAPKWTEWTDIEWAGELPYTDLNGDDDTVVPELLGIGDGKANTDFLQWNDFSGQAPDRCLDLTFIYNGFTFDDWFLPSYDELTAMVDNLHDQSPPVGDFAEEIPYWSSSELNRDKAYTMDFTPDYQYPIYWKYELLKVRAVRAF
jgi:hypothetical protein